RGELADQDYFAGVLGVAETLQSPRLVEHAQATIVLGPIAGEQPVEELRAAHRIVELLAGLGVAGAAITGITRLVGGRRHAVEPAREFLALQRRVLCVDLSSSAGHKRKPDRLVVVDQISVL